MPGEGNRHGQNSRGERERHTSTCVSRECKSVCKHGCMSSKGNRPSEVGGERCVTAQRTDSVGGTAVSRARTMENLTIVASRTITQASWGTGSPPPYGDAGGYPDPPETG